MDGIRIHEMEEARVTSKIFSMADVMKWND